MNKRLVWNFELSLVEALPKVFLLPHSVDNLRWEARYFWHETDTIVLDWIDESWFDLTQFKIKHHDDIYLLEHTLEFNIKKRRQDLVYKPQLDCKEGLFAFGKKIKLVDLAEDILLPGKPPIRGAQLQEQLKLSHAVGVDKIALSWRFASEPAIKLELSRLKIGSETYFSVCIEGYSFALVQAFSQFVVKKTPHQSYIHFLKSQGMTWSTN